MKKQVFEITQPGQDARYVRETANVAQRILREIHQQGLHASLRRIKNASERREILASVAL